MGGAIQDIRKAHESEGAVITQVALRSKAHWGYDQDFLARCAPDLTVDQDYIRNHRVFVAVNGKNIAGFYSIVREEDGYYLDNMFILPEYIGQGLGRVLWEHMLDQFDSMQVLEFKLVAEPFASGFYEKMGAVQICLKESGTFPGRKLPLMSCFVCRDLNTQK